MFNQIFFFLNLVLEIINSITKFLKLFSFRAYGGGRNSLFIKSIIKVYFYSFCFESKT